MIQKVLEIVIAELHPLNRVDLLSRKLDVFPKESEIAQSRRDHKYDSLPIKRLCLVADRSICESEC